MRFISAAALALVAVPVLAAAHPAWTATVAAGEGGSHILGNPAAKVKLTEFVSYTCPHCADFHKQADDTIKLQYVQSGRASLEVRHIVRDPVDMAAALLTNCGSPQQFFANHNLFLRSQDKWAPIMSTASSVQRQRWTSGTVGARMKAIANDFGFYRMMEQRGYRRQQLDQCLSDEAAAKRLAAQTQKAFDDGVEGTPSFMLNGVLLAGTHDWQSLAPQIKARF